jgi:hypothetical protein
MTAPQTSRSTLILQTCCTLHCGSGQKRTRQSDTNSGHTRIIFCDACICDGDTRYPYRYGDSTYQCVRSHEPRTHTTSCNTASPQMRPASRGVATARRLSIDFAKSDVRRLIAINMACFKDRRSKGRTEDTRHGDDSVRTQTTRTRDALDWYSEVPGSNLGRDTCYYSLLLSHPSN